MISKEKSSYKKESTDDIVVKCNSIFRGIPEKGNLMNYMEDQIIKILTMKN